MCQTAYRIRKKEKKKLALERMYADGYKNKHRF